MINRPKSPAEIEAMREGGKILATILQELTEYVKPGMTTRQLDDYTRERLKHYNVTSPLIGYKGFPDAICISLNDEVVHGIPSEKKVVTSGDLISFDLCVLHKNLITDAAVTTIVGQPRNYQDRLLVDTTKYALEQGLAQVRAGATVNDIGGAIQEVLEGGKYGIVRDFCGHGVGDKVHEEPSIENFVSRWHNFTLKEGMTIAIEPMATLGSHKVYITEDGWTVKTWDGAQSAHWEHTVAVTEYGCVILTEL